MNLVLFKSFLSLHSTTKLRQFLSLGIVLVLGWTTLACGNDASKSIQGNSELTTSVSSQNGANRQGTRTIADGKYDVQQATYNDGNGEYTLFLLNTPPGTSATFRTVALQMAQLTPEEISGGQKAYLQVKDQQAALHIPQDFKLEYVHNVVEQAQNPQTGQVEQRVVRQESNFWTPFAGALAGQVAGQVVGNMLFRPQYYVPPMYQPGGGLSGYGGYGSSYSQASNAYRQRYNEAPAVERNRTVYRATQRQNTGFGSFNSSRTGSSSSSNQRSTGKGFGSSNLDSSGSSGSYRRSPSSGFGSGRSSSFGSRSSSGGRRR